MLASIPSPTDPTLNIGPLELHYYGIVIAIGVAIAFSLTRRRFERYGGDGELADRIMVWTVVIGFLGGRTGYVITHLDSFFGPDARLAAWQVIAIWEGGLAFFGGIAFGTVAAFLLLRRFRQPVLPFFDAVAIAVPVAQAIGRIGNYFNQELFGSPSTLPWAIEIAPGKRPVEHLDATTFHPTFLYEMILNLLAAAVIVRLEKRRAWVKGSLFLIYLMLYGVIRFSMELLRQDPQMTFLGIRNNGWIAVGVFVVAGVVLLRRERGAGDVLAGLVRRDDALLAGTVGSDEAAGADATPDADPVAVTTAAEASTPDPAPDDADPGDA